MHPAPCPTAARKRALACTFQGGSPQPSHCPCTCQPGERVQPLLLTGSWQLTEVQLRARLEGRAGGQDGGWGGVVAGVLPAHLRTVVQTPAGWEACHPPKAKLQAMSSMGGGGGGRPGLLKGAL